MNNTTKINESARRMIESLFEYKVKNTKTKTASLEFVGKKLNNQKEYADSNDYRIMFYTHFIKFYKKHSRVFNFEEFVSVYAIAISEACAAFGDRFPDFETEFKVDRKKQLETMRYIKKTAEPLIYAEANPTNIKTKIKDTNVNIKLEATSIEAIQAAYQKNDSEFELTDDNILFGASKVDVDKDRLFEWNPLVKHFLENKERVLTAKQLEFYNKFKDNYVDNNNQFVTKKQALKESGYTQAQYHSFLENIAKRAETDFNKFGKKKSMSEDYRTGLIKALKNFVQVVENKASIHLRNLNTSRIVQDNYEEEAFEVIILKGLTTEEKQHVVRTVKGQHYLKHKIINKIYKNIKEYLENNELQDVKASEAKSTYTESLFTDEQKENVSTHYTVDAKGVTHAQDYSDIKTEINEVKVSKLEDTKAM